MKTLTYRFASKILEDGSFRRPYLLSTYYAHGVSSPSELRDLVRELYNSGAKVPPLQLNRFDLPPCVEVVRDRGFVVEFVMTLPIPEIPELKPYIEEPQADVLTKTISRSRYHRLTGYLIGDDFVVEGQWYRHGGKDIYWQYGDPVPAVPITRRRGSVDTSRTNTQFIYLKRG